MKAKLKIKLVDTNPSLIQEWQREFISKKDVEVIHGNLLEQEADTIVSPANSFGIMDGGIDLSIKNFFGQLVEDKIRRTIRECCEGELLVGEAMRLKTGHSKFPWMISAPTMRLPGDIRNTVNAYLSTKAALVTASYLPRGFTKDIYTVAFCGMGTGTGNISPRNAARQMRIAYEEIVEDRKPEINTWDDVVEHNGKILGYL